MATTKVAVAPMKAAQIPKPGAGQMRIKVEACGICHSEVLTKDGKTFYVGGSRSAVQARAPRNNGHTKRHGRVGSF